MSWIGNSILPKKKSNSKTLPSYKSIKIRELWSQMKFFLLLALSSQEIYCLKRTLLKEPVSICKADLVIQLYAIDVVFFNILWFFYIGRLEETKNILKIKEDTCLEMTLEMERTRALELKAFHEKEEIRSKLEETYEEKDRIGKVIYV